MKQETLKLVDVTKDNFADFKELVEQQAEHHLCKYRGNDDAFLSEITNPQSPAHVMMGWDMDANQAMGYVLYNVMHGLKGKEIYIEDIPALDDFKPDFIFISAGFDAHKEDPPQEGEVLQVF